MPLIRTDFYNRLALQLLLLLLLSLSLTGCDREAPQPIQWQLPLTTAPDPHRAPANRHAPDWARSREGSIQLRLLATNSAKQYILSIPMHGEGGVQDLRVRLQGLASGLRVRGEGDLFDDPTLSNPAAFIEIRRNQQLLFSGWIYRNFPEMFTPDIAGWKFFLDDATVRVAPRDTESVSRLNITTGSLSSAG